MSTSTADAHDARGAAAEYELVLEDGTRVPVPEAMTIGRAPGNTLVLADPAVSRHHARITRDGAGLAVQDAGSSYGTRVDGVRARGRVPLRDGARIRLGDRELVVARRRRDSEAGLTVVVPSAGGSDGAADAPADAPAGHPRLRPGYALKRLAASEGPQRWVLRDLRSDRFLRLDDEDGRLIELLDGSHSIVELIGEAERRLGPDGPPRVARLLAGLADRGLLDGAGDDDPRGAPTGGGALRRLAAPREWAWPGAAAWLERLYAAGAWRLLTRPALAVLASVAVAGVAVFWYLVAARYGTPFVVGRKIGLGGLVFIIGRLTVAAVHETAHGLAMTALGRRVGRAGLKLVLVFPFVFVDTSEAWFESRRRRMAVSAAGPASDAVLGGVFSLLCLTLGDGAVRQICFQLAFGAYLGALVNLNPLVDRDGYQILSDWLREPALRRRAREELATRLRGDAVGPPSPVLVRYAVCGLLWSVVAAVAAIVMSLRYAPALRALLPGPVVTVLLGSAWAAVLAPVAVAVGPPLFARLRRGP